MIVVNLFGGPGSGKSTGAAYIFSKLKMLGVNCELVTEFAKDKVWEGNTEVFKNQAYIFGKQYFKLTRVAGKVDVIITDSPLLNSVLYNKDPVLGNNFNSVVIRAFNTFDNMNYLIKRVKKYNPKGRMQTEGESDLIYNEILDILEENELGYTKYDGCEEDYDKIVLEVLDCLN